MTKDLQRILECPVCFITPENPEQAHFCTNGHMICGSCRKNVQKCPVCRSVDLKGQNPLLKQVLSAMPKLCPFEGCDAEPEDNELEAHKKSCQHRLIDCITHSRYGCNEKIPFHSFLKHLEGRHKISNSSKNGPTRLIIWPVYENNFNQEFISWLPLILKVDKETFMLTLIKKNNFFHCRCFFYGNETNARKYTWELKGKSQEFPNTGFALFGEVISVDVKRTEHEKEFYLDNFTFSNTMARKLWIKNVNHFAFVINIKKFSE